MHDLNNSIATTYDRENRGIPRLFARRLTGLAPPVTSTSVIHDNACGPAIVTSELLARLFPDTTPSIAATDISPAMIAAADALIASNNWQRVTATVMDSQKLTFADDTFSHSFTNFLVPSAPAALAEIYRTLQPGGTALFTTWKSHGFVQLMRRCNKVVLGDSAPPAPPATTEEGLRVQFEGAGFARGEVRVEAHCEELRFEGLDDLVALTEGPFGKFFTKDWRPEDVERMPDVVNQVLTAEERERWSVDMVAWIVIAKKT